MSKNPFATLIDADEDDFFARQEATKNAQKKKQEQAMLLKKQQLEKKKKTEKAAKPAEAAPAPKEEPKPEAAPPPKEAPPAPKKETPKEVAPKKETPKDAAPKKETSKKDTPKDAAPKKETPKEAPAKETTPAPQAAPAKTEMPQAKGPIPIGAVPTSKPTYQIIRKNVQSDAPEAELPSAKNAPQPANYKVPHGERPIREGQRQYDRRSGTGRGTEMKKEGHGKGNWGFNIVTPDVVPTENVEPESEEKEGAAKTESIAEGKAKKGAKATTPAAPTKEESEDDSKKKTVDEYLAEKAKEVVPVLIQTIPRNAGDGENTEKWGKSVRFVKKIEGEGEARAQITKTEKKEKKEKKEKPKEAKPKPEKPSQQSILAAVGIQIHNKEEERPRRRNEAAQAAAAATARKPAAHPDPVLPAEAFPVLAKKGKAPAPSSSQPKKATQAPAATPAPAAAPAPAPAQTAPVVTN